MWQVLLAAALAGSGFCAKRLFNINAETTTVSEQTEQKCDQSKEQQHFDDDSSQHQVSIFRSDDHNCEVQSSTFGDESIFRFSSSGSRGRTRSRFGSKNARKKLGSFRGIRGNVEGFREIEVGKVEKEFGFVEDHRKSGKRFAVCLKKRRTNKNATGKCESCFSKDNSFYGWGLGIGMMCMMSAGKAEICRLNTAMDETVKVVQELKTELSKRKSLRNLHVSNSEAEVNTNPKKIRGKHTQTVLSKSSRESDFEVSGFPTEEGECSSSVLTEEQLPEVLEIDQLEAELESELQKLPWCSKEASGLEGRRSNICETELSAEGFNEPEDQTSNSHQFNGVLPSELDQKLCHLLIEQQESQIVELESELHQANSKLNEKEAELHALKDCVRRLTEFSLATASDEETEAQVEGEKNSEGDYEKKMGPESKKSVVGVKRAMDFE
uniref:Uncharacterized protein n=1 Tax=Davidia involucrata TaxID=16924 RepID=A0A5B7C2V3_DAVIN